MTKPKPKCPSEALIGNIATIEPLAVREYDAAAMLGVSISTLKTWRTEGTGPRYRRLSRRTVVYPVAELKSWLLSDLEGGSEGVEADD